MNAASFFAVMAVLLTLTLPKPSEHAHDQKLFHSIVDGFRFVRREPGLRINAIAMCVNTFLAAPFIALVPAMAEKVLHSDIATTILIAAQGTGAVLMAFSLGWFVERFGPRRLLVGLMGLLPFALAAYAYAPDVALSALALFFVGGLYLGALSSFSTVAQLRAPAAIRGRVLAVNTMILGALYPLGAVIQGKIADGIGLRVTTFGAAAIMAVVLGATRLVRPGITARSTIRSRYPWTLRWIRFAVMAVVEMERRGNIALVTLNRPEARNAVSPEVSQTMAAILDEVEADAALRAVVLTGRGEVFCAGADLKVVAQGNANDIARGKGGFAGLVTRDFPKPIIAAVNGPALAGGFEIVLSCDLVVAADTARFGIPEVKRGLMAAAGGLIRLPKRVPLAVALELAMTGDPVDATARAPARAREPGRGRRPGRRRGDRAGRPHRRELAHRGAQLPPAGARGRRDERGRRLDTHVGADDARVRERRRRRGRHRVRGEAPTRLAQHLNTPKRPANCLQAFGLHAPFSRRTVGRVLGSTRPFPGELLAGFWPVGTLGVNTPKIGA